jgi:CheY-like chemotaxis protein
LSSTERSRTEANRLKGIRVLVVDDAPDNLQLTYRYLKNAGAEEVACFESATQALDLLAREPYHVVLMDIQMPILDGYSAVRILREKNYKGPVLALTAHAMKGERERCLAAGFDDYLIKPIDRAALIGAISSHANWPT